MSNQLVLDISQFNPSQVAQILTFVKELETALIEDTLPMVDLENVESTGWTVAHIEYLRTQLEERGNTTQLAVFDRAIQNGGYVKRAEVYAIGNYDAERQLKRWTMPFQLITDELIAEHGLPETASLAINVDYGAGKSYRPLKGYIVAPEIVQVMRA